MFGRKDSTAAQPVEDAAPAQPDPQAPKGRPTPSRKEAEAARRDARRIPSDPKAAKRAAKDRARAERETARIGMMNGDERYLPARDQGPVRAFARDWIDRRRRLSEFFVFVALGILFAGFVPNRSLQASISFIWFGITLVVAIEMVWTLVSLNTQLKRNWPNKADRKGTLFYAGMRALQIRRLRVPAPRVKASLRPTR